MNNNSIMRLAQRNKKDEFYTQREDIDKELSLYAKQFKDKTIFFPCDSNESEFVRYMDVKFESWHLKCFYALSYNSDGNATLITETRDEITQTQLENDNGDFRTSPKFQRLLKECDIIITNPPFSLFREFMLLLLNTNKQFIILGNMNQILTKDLFPYVVSSRLWFGPSIYSGDRLFRVPEDYPLNATGTFVDENNNRFIRVKGVRWFTNMHPDNPAASRAIVPTVSYKDMTYERFDYMPNIICINKTSDIPYDYDGLIGVPLTYFDRHNPELFDIIDGVNRYLVLDALNINSTAIKNHQHLLTVDGKVKYFRFLIRRKRSTTI